MRHVFVNADDFGLHDDINRAISEGVKKGRIHGVSVSANGTAVDWPLLREMKSSGAKIGAHLTWADETWLTGQGSISRAAIIKKLALHSSGFVNQLRDEARAQIDLLLKNGIHPDHVDSHQHIHVLPNLWPITLELAREYSIPRIRIPMASSFAGIRKTPGGMLLHSLSRFRSREIPTAWPCAGIARSGHNTEAHVQRELSDSRDQVVELIVHPGFATSSLTERYRHWNYDWETERSLIMDDDFPRMLKVSGCELMPSSVIVLNQI